ncbi:restriction system protein [Thermoanaerobacter uzonensis DSM 18761]|uniref:Restriction system protein n=1 Tax=Thermoanaerobacter uzonensis DSM 18761 TaxID=1123369 RepID=A0A1M5AA03_9THEO|nr:restriction endonuclease [Thermoanaerobacter uzonensis]SHF27099.1 restriction system protein [Thermoanaerobacter uzonensis DSM 18761]
MAIPTYEEIMLPLLKILSDGGIHKYKELEEKLKNVFNLTEEEVNSRSESGVKIFYNRIGWAATYLKKEGLLESPKRGEFKITEEGSKLLAEGVKHLDYKYLMKYDSFKEFKLHKEVKGPDGYKREPEDNMTPFERISNAYNEIKDSLIDELLQKLKEVDSYKFEEIVLDLLIKMGYGGSKEEAKERTQKTNDEGIDGIINEDKLRLDKIYIQAKRWKDRPVGRPDVQAFAGALDGHGASKGIFITTSNFTKEAKEYVERLTTKKIILIDGYRLAEYMIDFNVGVIVQELYEIKRIDNNYFEE